MPKYKDMHIRTVDAVNKHLLFRPMIPDEKRDLRFSSKINFPSSSSQPPRVKHEAPHLTCFLGGMYALGGRIFGRADDVDIGAKLTDGCVWAYESTASGVMSEGGTLAACPKESMLKGGECKWNETAWHQELDPEWSSREDSIERWHQRKEQYERNLEEEKLEALHPEPEPADSTAETKKKKKRPLVRVGDKPLTHTEYIAEKLRTKSIPPGYITMEPRYYILRPEAIESVWYMYRITGDSKWMDKGWAMFEKIEAATRAQWGYSAIDDVSVTKPSQNNSQESFWMAETLKYFYLLFAGGDVLSLDEWVLNTEAVSLGM